MRWFARFGLALLGLLVAVAVLLLRPVHTSDLASQPAPAVTYEEGVRRAEELLARDGEAVNPLCRSRLLAHNQRTTRVVVLWHGFTNCPYQFALLGETLHQRGYTVLIPRQPRHGLTDRMADALADLSAREMAAAADEAIDIARGLGDEVVVAGLSSAC